MAAHRKWGSHQVGKPEPLNSKMGADVFTLVLEGDFTWGVKRSAASGGDIGPREKIKNPGRRRRRADEGKIPNRWQTLKEEGGTK